MWYEINVSLNGRHFFATNPRSILTLDDCRKVLGTLLVKFPEQEGYDISVMHCSSGGKVLDVADIMNMEVVG